MVAADPEVLLQEGRRAGFSSLGCAALAALCLSAKSSPATGPAAISAGQFSLRLPAPKMVRVAQGQHPQLVNLHSSNARQAPGILGFRGLQEWGCLPE